MEKDVQDKFAGYPKDVRHSLMRLRELILQVVQELELGDITENLKWGEPSYSVKTGSPIRMDWKAASPEHYCLFFHCQTKLVDTFRELYSDTLVFEGNRAIILTINGPFPELQLKHCITLAMTYRNIKHLPLLGV
ncbi:DUF1801 domain-containing protein [Shewanella sp.]|uniref:DUF1801 domain-containing protein n=1 Tax=Shewanella sp. TaxID=50422 RepID=UPI004053EE4C